MKKILLVLAILLPFSAMAQDTDFGGQASVGVDYKVKKGFHLTFDEEIRTGDFSSLGSLRTSAGVTYKPASFLKLGAGYTLINPYKSSTDAFTYPRHRVYFDVTGYLRAGDFQLSLRERLQLTHRTGTFNKYQTTPNALALKSRLAVKYTAWKGFKPSLSFELRTALNDPWGSRGTTQKTNNSGKTYYAYTPDGYSHMYNNRFRIKAGGDVRLTRQHHLEPFVMFDSCNEYELDTNGDGTRLFSAGYEKSNRFVVGVGYVFNF